jgi:uncharacterized protein YidB (DUF937 family)
MELMDLFRTGAVLIKGNNDEATTGLDIEDIAQALSKLISNSDGTLDLSTLMIGLSQNGLGDIINSWLGNGQNFPISAEQVTVLFGSQKISSFASQLNISEESAANALADALPQVVDRATGGGDSIVDEMLGQVDGSQNAMDMLSKMFR